MISCFDSLLFNQPYFHLFIWLRRVLVARASSSLSHAGSFIVAHGLSSHGV